MNENQVAVLGIFVLGIVIGLVSNRVKPAAVSIITMAALSIFIDNNSGADGYSYSKYEWWRCQVLSSSHSYVGYVHF
mgnify:CR=1 FL=1